MKAIWIVLIILAFIILLGPLMLLFAKLNKVDPYILEKEDIINGNMTKEEERSFIIVNVFRQLFAPLWIETKIIKSFKKK